MTLAKYLTANKFGFWIDLRSMADTTMHGNGQRLVNTQDGVLLHHLGLADEHHGQAVGIGSVLG